MKVITTFNSSKVNFLASNFISSPPVQLVHLPDMHAKEGITNSVSLNNATCIQTIRPHSGHYLSLHMAGSRNLSPWLEFKGHIIIIISDIRSGDVAYLISVVDITCCCRQESSETLYRIGATVRIPLKIVATKGSF